MQPNIYKIEQVMPVTSVTTKNGQTNKQQVVLRQFGDDYADAFVVTLFGEKCNPNIEAGQLCVATLSSIVNEYEGRYYQENWCRAMYILN